MAFRALRRLLPVCDGCVQNESFLKKKDLFFCGHVGNPGTVGPFSVLKIEDQNFIFHVYYSKEPHLLQWEMNFFCREGTSILLHISERTNFFRRSTTSEGNTSVVMWQRKRNFQVRVPFFHENAHLHSEVWHKRRVGLLKPSLFIFELSSVQNL